MDEGICTHIKSIHKSINVDFNYGTTRLWRQDTKWSIGDTVEDPVTNSYANKSNLSSGVTGRFDVKISQPQTKEKISSRLLG